MDFFFFFNLIKTAVRLRIRWRQYKHGGVRQHWFGPHNVVVIDIVSSLSVTISLGFVSPFATQRK